MFNNWKNTRKYAKLRSLTKSLMKKLCDDCKKKIVGNVHNNMNDGERLDSDPWCDECRDNAVRLQGLYDDYDKAINEDYIRNIKEKKSK